MFRKNRRKSTKKTNRFKVERGSHLRNRRRMNKILPPKRRKLNYKNIFKLILFIVFIVVICKTISISNKVNNTNDRLDTIIDNLEQIQTNLNDITNKQVELEEKQKALETAKAEKKAEEEKLAKEAEEKAKQEAVRVAKVEQTKVTSRGGTTSRSSSSVTTSTSSLQNYAHNLCINTYGWTENDFQCLVKLWNKESGWNPNAHNKSSGAHGIPQSLPASKMASEGADYYTNGETQIRWGLKYIKGRYGSPSNAWAFWQSHNWY